MFVTFEGIGGAGKTTQAALLRDWLESLELEVVLAREPGGTRVGEELRTLLLTSDIEISPRTEMALFAAARAQLVDEVIRPALQRGAVVVCDRYVDSSVVYQGALGCLGQEAVLQLNSVATQGLMPDITFVLLVDPALAQARRVKSDRVEPRDRARLLALHRAYEDLARSFPERVVTVDASASVESVFNLVRETLSQHLQLRRQAGHRHP